jgi:2-methylcitrate dehydratase
VVIETNAYSHVVIGSGANDPQKFDPDASRETLDHSSMYIFAVALEDAAWHHEESYSSERAHRPETLALWRKVRTVEDPEWTRRFLASDRPENAFGGRVVITFEDGSTVTDEIAVADAHPLGASPFDREQYVAKFVRLADPVVAAEEQRRFLEAAQNLEALSPEGVDDLTFTVASSILDSVGKQRAGLLG